LDSDTTLWVEHMAVQPDGKILLSIRTELSSTPDFVRLESDGKRDDTFNTVGLRDLSRVTKIVPTLDGKILIVASFSDAASALFRLHSDGAVDEGFQPYLMPSEVNPHVFAADRNGKIHVGGISTNSLTDIPQPVVLRLTSDGRPDLSFPEVRPEGVTAWSTISTLHIDPDGQLLAAGLFRKVNGVPRQNLVRLHTTPSPVPVVTEIQVHPEGTSTLFIHNVPGRSLEIEASEDLTTWKEVSSSEPTSANQAIEILSPAKHRFFRARSVDASQAELLVK
jgi:uncharacterized delta-60 repeat protein